jgi:DNA-binding response OmpR family regulator
MSSLLVVEDEKHLADGLRFNLEAEGHHVRVVGDGEKALELLTRKGHDFDAVVLDVMLPGKNGFQVAAAVRNYGEFVPILMLTARGRPEDVLQGFESGADDYLAKPFELKILIARIAGLLRRREWLLHADGSGRTAKKSAGLNAENERPQTFAFAGKVIDFSGLELRVGKQSHRLTVMEAELLRYLVANAGKAVSRKAILEDVWGLHEDTDTRAIDNFIARLRKYVEDKPSSPKHLLTVRGVGYKFVPETGKARK